jgi:hypothetical protein
MGIVSGEQINGSGLRNVCSAYNTLSTGRTKYTIRCDINIEFHQLTRIKIALSVSIIAVERYFLNSYKNDFVEDVACDAFWHGRK